MDQSCLCKEGVIMADQTYLVTPVKEAKQSKSNQNTQRAFSKWLLIQESVLIWIITVALIILAFYCVINQYFGELPWITAMTGFPWTAYGVSQAFYYRKSEKENTKNGIVYETALLESYAIDPNDNTPVG